MTGIEVQRWAGAATFDPAAPAATFRAAGLSYYAWGNGPGDRYGEHAHSYDKTLVCLEGSITFHVPGEAALVLTPGDCLVLPAGTRHAATVGPAGVRCEEAHGRLPG
ncbi:MAG TPA: cupin domain-containing protein [Chloroflexia bacterium]|nr:cupin domain-containing protein [Chloroflexia bacterium]